MNNDLLTLAIHTPTKANILKSILEKEGIKVYLEKVQDVSFDENENMTANSYYVKIKSTDLSKAIVTIEANKLFSYNDKKTYTIDDGRQRILVAVDFSNYSMKACQIAFNIAKQLNAKVKILHVYHNIYFPSHIPFAETLKDFPDQGQLDKIRKQMLNLCLEIDKKISEGKWPSINYSYSIREGIVEEEIENFIDEYKPSLLVMGTRGKDDNQSNIFGNVTADVIEMTNVPVLAVPENSPLNSFSDVKHVAFVTNLQIRDMSSFALLVNLLSPFPEIKITLVHINQINRKGDRWTENELKVMKENTMERYPQFNVDYKLIDSPDIPMAIADFIKEENVTVACINTRRRNLFGRIFIPSISRKVLVKSDAALLVFRG